MSPGATAHFNWDRKLRIATESSFGTVNGSPSWTVLPILGDGYKLQASRPGYKPDTNMEGYQRSISIQHSQEVTGSHTMLAWPSVVETVLDAAMSRDANDDLTSYTHDFYSPVAARRILGAVAESLTINVTGTGDADVQFETTWRGKEETDDDSLSEGDIDYSSIGSVPFMFRDAALTLDGSTVTTVQEFSISVENNVAQGPLNGGLVAYLIAGGRDVSLDLTKVQEDEALRTALRNGNTVSFEAAFTHPLGHSMTFLFNALQVPEDEESTSRDEPTTESPTLEALKSGATDEFQYTVSLDSSTTTTTSGV